MSTQHVQYMILFLVLAVNSDRFKILQSYTLLLKPPVSMRSSLLSTQTEEYTKHRRSLRMWLMPPPLAFFPGHPWLQLLFACRFCILQNWSQGRPGNEATLNPFHLNSSSVTSCPGFYLSYLQLQ